MTIKREALLIELIKENDDSTALNKLVKRYRPMIDSMYNKYFIDGYDRNDWYQEAFIVCYQTCKLYDGTAGSKFGSFFKLKFQNHIIDIIRRENAIKRKANIHAESYDTLVVSGHADDLIIENNDSLEFSNHVEKVLEGLSSLELLSFQVILGKTSMNEACLSARCDTKQIMRAVHRCKLKIKSRI